LEDDVSMHSRLICGSTVFAALVGFCGSQLAAQERDTSALRMPNQSVYFETGGSTGQLSLSYDRKLNDWATLRAGYGRWFVLGSVPGLSWGDQPNAPNKHATLIPLTINLVPRIRPGSMHRIELSAGIVAGKRWESAGARRSFRATTAMVGYRATYRPVVFRAGLYYSERQFGDFPCAGWRPALSFGQQF
jgi:hypothetical protein